MKTKAIAILISLLAIATTQNSALADGKKHEHHSKGHFSGLETEPAKIVNQFHKALGAKKQELAKNLLAENVLIYEGGRVERSASEYAHHHMLADMEYISSVDVETLEHQVKVFGDLAVSSSRTKTKGVFKGKKINRSGMETMVLRKIQGKWKITHIHWSN